MKHDTNGKKNLTWPEETKVWVDESVRAVSENWDVTIHFCFPFLDSGDPFLSHASSLEWWITQWITQSLHRENLNASLPSPPTIILPSSPNVPEWSPFPAPFNDFYVCQYKPNTIFSKGSKVKKCLYIQLQQTEQQEERGYIKGTIIVYGIPGQRCLWIAHLQAFSSGSKWRA